MRRLLVLTALAAALTAGAQQRIVRLWNNASAPHDNGLRGGERVEENRLFNTTEAVLYVYAADPARATGQAAVVCPGGGYRFLSIGGDGHAVGRWLAGTRRHRRRVEIPPAQRPMRGTARRHRSGAALSAPHGSGLPRRLRAGGDRGVFGGRPPGRFGRHDAPRRGAPRLRRADLSRHYGRTGQMPQRVVRPLAGHRPHGPRRNGRCKTA